MDDCVDCVDVLICADDCDDDCGDDDDCDDDCMMLL